MKTQKEKVLAKCETCKTNQGGWMPVGESSSGLSCEYVDGYFQIGSPHHVVCLKFNEETHSESIVWPLAAQILGIGEKESTELRFVCKVGLGTAKAGNFMYHVIKWDVKILSSLCIGCKQYTKDQMSRGQAEVMLEFRDAKSKDGFVNDMGIALEAPAKVHLNSTRKEVSRG